MKIEPCETCGEDWILTETMSTKCDVAGKVRFSLQFVHHCDAKLHLTSKRSVHPWSLDADWVCSACKSNGEWLAKHTAVKRYHSIRAEIAALQVELEQAAKEIEAVKDGPPKTQHACKSS